jgi:AcrR family transcriptional regulator
MSTYHHGDLRSAVLAAAGKIIEKEGLARLSVREAARRAGVSHNAPYRHFRDRDALLAALAIEGFAQLERALEGRSGRSLGEAYVRFALEHPQRFRLMSASPQMATLQQRFASTFAELGAGTEIAAAAAWSLVHGLAQLILDGQLKRDDDFVNKVIGAIRVAQRSA